MKAAIFDFRNLDDEFQQMELKTIKYWQFQRLLKTEWQERMTQFLNKRQQKKSLNWLSRLVSAVFDEEEQALLDLYKLESSLSDQQRFFSYEYAIAILHSSQLPLKELLLQETPDILVITTDDRQARLAGVFQQAETTRTASPPQELSDGE